MMDHPMHDHELDLIMALTAGTLSGTELEAAEATIAACDGCAAELAAQRLAVAALATAEAPSLSELEGARMRRALRDELGLVVPEPVPAETGRRSIPWQRLSVALSAAAVLLLFVAVVPGLDLFGGAGNDDAADTVAFATTTAAAESAPDAGRMESADEIAPGLTTTGDASTTMVLEAPTEGRLVIDFGADPDLSLLQFASARGLTETGDAANLLGIDVDRDSLFIDHAVESCVEEALASFADDRTAVVLGTGRVADEDVFVVAYVDEGAATVELIAHETSTCRVVASQS